MKKQLILIFGIMGLLFSCQKYRSEDEFIELQKKTDSLEVELKATKLKLHNLTDSLQTVIKSKDSVINVRIRRRVPSYQKKNRLSPIKKEEKVA